MSDFQFVKDSIGAELDIFNKKFAETLKSSTPLLDTVMKFIIKRKGKQLRPMFVLLSAQMAGGINESSYRAAALVELLHTATLVHDDVVDESMERRGFFSVNALWKNKVAVLVGDYLLSRGLLLSTANEDFMHLHILSDAVRMMSEGELLQIEKSRRLNLNEEIYFEIIRKKTASLIASACAAGAYSAKSDLAIAEKMKIFGEKVGIAFQIKDDLLDYGNEAVGKPTRNDIKEKKLTLPLIHVINLLERKERNRVLYILKHQNKVKEKVNYVIDLVVSKGGLDFARKMMEQYRNEALSILDEFPDIPAKKALEELVLFTTNRKY
jgi:octaprenyl-diphosphate synthase